jgi:hypothetical protein
VLSATSNVQAPLALFTNLTVTQDASLDNVQAQQINLHTNENVHARIFSNGDAVFSNHVAVKNLSVNGSLNAPLLEASSINVGNSSHFVNLSNQGTLTASHRIQTNVLEALTLSVGNANAGVQINTTGLSAPNLVSSLRLSVSSFSQFGSDTNLVTINGGNVVVSGLLNASSMTSSQINAAVLNANSIVSQANANAYVSISQDGTIEATGNVSAANFSASGLVRIAQGTSSSVTINSAGFVQASANVVAQNLIANDRVQAPLLSAAN